MKLNFVELNYCPFIKCSFVKVPWIGRRFLQSSPVCRTTNDIHLPAYINTILKLHSNTQWCSREDCLWDSEPLRNEKKKSKMRLLLIFLHHFDLILCLTDINTPISFELKIMIYFAKLRNESRLYWYFSLRESLHLDHFFYKESPAITSSVGILQPEKSN